MRRIAILLVLLAVAALSAAIPAQAGPPDLIVTANEARTVATNWIALTIHYEGTWGDSEAARVAEVREFRRGDRLLGYFCRVEPKGYIIVSLRGELGAVKAHSYITVLNPDSETGLTDLLKDTMERQLDWVEELAGPIETASAEALARVLEINYRSDWDELAVDPLVFAERLRSGVSAMNYAGGEPPLLTSHWGQGNPYNIQCPTPSPNSGCKEANCAVGCTATAGVQVMRYWAWPPYGAGGVSDPYEWRNMPDMLNPPTPTPTPSQAQINAVADLSHDMGVAVGMKYCLGGGTPPNPCASGAPFTNPWGKDLLDAFENNFRYSDDADNKDRNDYSAVGWFNAIKAQLNLNRPVPYGLLTHVIVCDGWKEEGIVPSRYYHMNYGWEESSCTTLDGCDVWYPLDSLHLGGKDDEQILVNVYPETALKWSVEGFYTLPIAPHYRYFDRDCWGKDAEFDAGHYLQFLQNVKVVCNGTRIAFYGWSTDNTRLFSRGDPSRGIRIQSGHLYLYNGGGIRLY
jgi:hypothetical protein